MVSKNTIIRPGDIDPLLKELRKLIVSARKTATRAVDTIQVATNFEIGRRIVEHEQQGKARAEYGKVLLRALSLRITEEFGRGFSLTNLKLMRQFYQLYRDRIGQTVSGQFDVDGKSQTLSDQLTATKAYAVVPEKMQTLSAPFRLSWSHYVFLLGIKNPDERNFYEIEAAEQSWSLREMKRQFDSGLFERLALSRDKEGVRELARRGQVVGQPKDLLKDPYVLEFLGLDEKARYSESDLEFAIIGKIEHFLLELGKGFLFEAREKRFTFEEDHFFVDLVFYNRLLRCYVLIDLKIGKLTHQDMGQMQMYVNYFDRHVRLDDENRTVGIILCKKKSDALVEITHPTSMPVSISFICRARRS